MTNYKYHDIESVSKPCKKLMIMLHGLGSNGEDLISLVPFLQQDLPDYYFTSPDAIEAYDMAPFGKQWFSLQNRDPAIIMRHVSNNRETIEDLILQKQQELSLTNKDTILLGFSQGTMIASYLTLNAKEPFLAMIGFSGRMLPTYVEKVNKNTPICLIHGLKDDVVSADESEKFAHYCQERNIPCEIKMIPNLRHSIDHQALEFALNFLKKL